jgi:aldehyde dehydrogenase (NAD+)
MHGYLLITTSLGSVPAQLLAWRPWQLESLKRVLFEFYGEEPLRSPDLSRVVNSNHFNRLMALMDDYSVSGNVAFGGQIDERRL